MKIEKFLTTLILQNTYRQLPLNLVLQIMLSHLFRDASKFLNLFHPVKLLKLIFFRAIFWKASEWLLQLERVTLAAEFLQKSESLYKGFEEKREFAF